MKRGLVGVMLAVGALLSGCVEESSADSAPQPSAGPAVFTDESGGIEGRVTDEELTPVSGATVGLIELPEISTTTDDQGQFALSRIPPGSYKLAVQKLGYHAVAKNVEVAAASSVQVSMVLESLAVPEAYPETVTNNGIIRNGVGVIRTATCTNCAVNDQNKETVTRFAQKKLPEDYAGVMIESTWNSRDFIGLDFLDRSKGEMYWRIRSEPPVHFLLERCGNYVGAPHFGRQPLPCAEENLTANKIHLENWYVGEFQDETHTLDPVCQTPTGPLPGYQAGCYGLGFVAELRFTNYLTVFHLELPGDIEQWSAMPDR